MRGTLKRDGYGGGAEEGGDEAEDGRGDLVGREAVRGVDPFPGGAVDSPAGGGGDEFGGVAAGGGMSLEAVEEHGADDGDDGGLHVRGHVILGIVRGGGAGEREGLGEEVADAEDDALDGGGAGAVEDDAALVEQGVEAGGDHALEQGELVGVVGVKGGAVDAGVVGNLLDGEFFEFAGGKETGEGLLEELAGAANAGVDRVGIGSVRHGVSGLEYGRLAKDCCISDECRVSLESTPVA
jgi:hypothetical protein